MDFQPLKYIYKPSENPDAYTFLLLHGTGGNETDLIPLTASFGSNYNILSLRGNVLEHGMPRFFKRLGMGVFDEEDLHFRTDEMVAFVNGLAIKEGFNPSKIIALGYSNGGNIAGAALLKHPGFLAGAILYRPMQPFKNPEPVTQKSNTKVFISAGKHDPTVNYGATVAYVDLLRSMGVSVDFHEIATGHNLVQEDIALSSEWLSENFVI